MTGVPPTTVSSEAAPGRALLCVALAVWLTGAVAHESQPLPAAPPPPVEQTPRSLALAPLALNALPCATEAACPGLRHLELDPVGLGLEALPGLVPVVYDPEPLVGPVSAEELPYEDPLSLAVRLIISEVGADRLVYSRFGLLEAVGILYTVHNRLDRAVYDPLEMPTAPAFPGCGPGGDFGSCANPEQYLGMATWRALHPARHYDPAVLDSAVELAVTAHVLVERGWMPDFTEGATNYVHRCGAAGYGRTTHHCDAHLGRPERDIAGANPHTGPTVFRAPERWRASRGWYTLYESRWVDFDPWWPPEHSEAWDQWQAAQAELDAAGLAAWDGIADAEDGDLEGIVEVIEDLEPVAPPPVVALVNPGRQEPETPELTALVNGLGPPGDLATHSRVWSIYAGKR